MRKPLSRRAPLRERSSSAKALSKIREDRIVVARQTERFCNLMHGNHQRIVGGIADVLALQRHGTGQNDVGMSGSGSPREFVNYQCIEPGKGLAQAIEVLVMMKRISTRPVDETDIGISARL